MVDTGIVVSRQPGTNMVDVRLAGNRIVRNVTVPYGISFQEGDSIVVAAPMSQTGLVAVARLQDPDSYALAAAAEVSGKFEMHPPSGFAVTALQGLIIAEWEGWSGRTLCFDVQHNATATESTAVTFYTRGSYFLYPTTVATTRHIRVRTIRYDVARYVAYYSGWTSWASATSVPGVSQAAFDALNDYVKYLVASIEDEWGLHLLGEN
jgi:hypothetical protein